MNDHYTVLRILRSARTEEIKTAYRLRAKETYPGHGGNGTDDSDGFCAVQEAYEVLSDPVRRSDYDRSLPTTSLVIITEDSSWPKSTSGDSPPYQWNRELQPWDKHAPKPKVPSSTMPVTAYWSQHNVDLTSYGYIARISLKQSYEGVKVKLRKERDVVCPWCRGRRFTLQAGPTCNICGGTGQAGERNFFTALVFGDPCKNCDGSGSIKVPKDCSCRDGKTSEWDENIVHLARGVSDGTVLSVPGGDTLSVEIHNFTGFSREGDNLFFAKEVTATQLEKGTSLQIKCPDGSNRVVKVPSGCAENYQLTLPRCGMPKKNGREFGDLTVTFRLRARSPASRSSEDGQSSPNAPGGQLDGSVPAALSDEGI